MSRLVPALALAAFLAACGSQPASPTWSAQVGPLVEANCTGCHVRGGIAPLPLETYDDVAAAKDAVLSAVQSRRMPPWQLEPGCGSFRGERRLSDADLDTLSRWVAAGAPKGEAGHDALTPPPGRALTRVDWEGKIDPPFTPPATKSDQYQCFILDPQLQTERHVVGYDVAPDVLKEVHHVLLFSVPRSDAQGFDAKDPGSGWSCFAPPTVAGARAIGVWVPGSSATVFPSGTGVRMGPEDVLVVQMHYNTLAGAPTPDASSVKLQFADRPVQTQLLGGLVGAGGFTIPPATTGYSATDTHDVPLDVSLYAVMPHMHLKGRTLRFETTHAGADTCLADVRNWRFDWQELVFFQKPVTLKSGDTVKVTCTWDNPSDQPVKEGEGTTDEMCLVLFMASF